MKKQCCKCHKLLEVSEFYKSSRDGYQSCCKACKQKMGRERRARISAEEKEIPKAKICSHCGVEKDYFDFGLNSTMTDGLQTWCKSCRHKLRKEKFNTDRDFRLRFNRYSNEWHRKKYATDSEWAGDRKKRIKQWQNANREKVRIYRRIVQHRRRARIRQSYGMHSAEDIERLMNSQMGKCLYCGQDLKAGYHIEHFLPLALGGSNGPENLVLSCPNCNYSKGSKAPWNWGNWNGEYPTEWKGRLI